MQKNTKRALIASGAVAAAAATAGIVAHNTTKYLVSVALDRQAPKSTKKSREKLSGVKDERYFELRRKDEALEKNSRVVTARSSDGEKLVGHWYECTNPKRVIIAMHGWRSSWMSDFSAIAPFWHDNDCNVLFAEQRGQNNSGGVYMSFGLMERYDCLAWIDWVNENYPDMPIYLGGISMGASTVLMAAGFELPENVKGIIADCGFTSPVDIWRHVVEKNLGMSYRLRKGAIQRMCRQKLQIDADGYSAVEAMENCDVPVLFIHGTDDHFVPIDMTYKNYKACRAPKRIFVVPGADHGMSYYMNREGYEAAVKEFWADCEA